MNVAEESSGTPAFRQAAPVKNGSEWETFILLTDQFATNLSPQAPETPRCLEIFTRQAEMMQQPHSEVEGGACSIGCPQLDAGFTDRSILIDRHNSTEIRRLPNEGQRAY
ncbi:hypothetical protein ACKWRH_07210 [Bradyrhizobium sp. Pa8]|uniref:hypothetical protein n=1 Tax=Bradyrhizobium sp. Pa8 TaxID=3386552 RepID=UPI00403F3495